MLITLQAVKEQLLVTHGEDDARIERLIRSATRECLNFLDRPCLPTDEAEECSSEPASEPNVPDDVFAGIVIMVQADYDGDPTQRAAIRKTAETLWWPYRKRLGV